MKIDIPDWCVIGQPIAWSAEEITGEKWVKELIHSFAPDGFYHQASGCPLYFTAFDEWGKTVKSCKEVGLK